MSKHYLIGLVMVAGMLFMPDQVHAGSFFKMPVFHMPTMPKHHSYGGGNSIEIHKSSTTIIGQSNDVENTNVVMVESDTGHNFIVGTTGAPSYNHSGDSNISVMISNLSGFNYLDVDTCDDCGDIHVVISGNGGSH